jgi:hypothetical protein
MADSTVIAWLGVGLSSASLTWQLVSWRGAGARLLVNTAYAHESQAGKTARALGVVVTNNGRLATSIHDVRIEVPKKKKVMGLIPQADHNLLASNYSLENELNQLRRAELPRRLEAGDQFIALYDAEKVIKSIRDGDLRMTEVVAKVRSGRKTYVGTFQPAVVNVSLPEDFFS